MRTLLVTLTLLGSLLVAAAEDRVLSLAQWKAEFQKHDRALNEVYAALKKELPEYRFTAMQPDQREWVGYRDYIAEGQARTTPDDPTQDVAYWEMMAGMTEGRIDYLKAWKGIGEQGAWTGTYSDGRGGLLEIVQAKEGIYFTCEVVRGTSFHVGVIGGLAKVNESMARFSVAIEGSNEECWISFFNDRNEDGRIELMSVNSHEFHGARAYFDATYLRVGLLDAAAQGRVIKSAKAGGMVE